MTTLYANTASGRVFIDDYDFLEHGICSCVCCQTTLRAKRGQKVMHHFAHVNKSNCEAWTDGQMTQWHRDWQLTVPEHFREIRIQKNNQLHIADIQLADGLVIEIQNSPLTHEEAIKRETFYNNMVWIVNGCDVVTKAAGNEACVLQGLKKWWGHDGRRAPVIVDTKWGLFIIKLVSKQMWIGVRIQNPCIKDMHPCLHQIPNAMSASVQRVDSTQPSHFILTRSGLGSSFKRWERYTNGLPPLTTEEYLQTTQLYGE